VRRTAPAGGPFPAAGPAPVQTAHAALAHYSISAAFQVELVRYGENTTYRVRAGRRSLALRLGRPGYQTRASMESEIAWMSALREHGVDTPQPVAGRDGEAVQAVAQPDGGAQLAIAFEWVAGVPLPQVAGLDPWRRLGEVMARVHEHGRNWSRPPGFTRPAWDLDGLVGDAPRWGTPVPDGVWSESEQRAILTARDAVRERLGRFGTSPDRFGLIHSDLGFENVLVQAGGKTVVIDFDDCGPSWYLYELASVLYPFEGSPEFRVRRDALTAGYRDVRALPDDEIAELTTFLMCRRLSTLGWTFTRGDTPHAQRQRAHRLATTPTAARRFLEWHTAHPPDGPAPAIAVSRRPAGPSGVY
jgi:Ser/Thr protein kinase RdoA (MazF antagonist)